MEEVEVDEIIRLQCKIDELKNKRAESIIQSIDENAVPISINMIVDNNFNLSIKKKDERGLFHKKIIEDETWPTIFENYMRDYFKVLKPSAIIIGFKTASLLNDKFFINVNRTIIILINDKKQANFMDHRNDIKGKYDIVLNHDELYDKLLEKGFIKKDEDKEFEQKPIILAGGEKNYRDFIELYLNHFKPPTYQKASKPFKIKEIMIYEINEDGKCNNTIPEINGFCDNRNEFWSKYELNHIFNFESTIWKRTLSFK